MPRPITLVSLDHPRLRGPEISIRHYPEFGIASVMPHAALAPHLRPPLPLRGRRVGANPVPSGACFHPDDGTLPGLQTTNSVGGR
jgi:hypothetical protein